MRAEIRAVGRIKAGPERALIDDYLTRAAALGRNLGLDPVTEREFDPRTLKDKRAETVALTEGVAPGALVVALDETGRALSSLQFSQMLQRAAEDGVRDAAFLIGGRTCPGSSAERRAARGVRSGDLAPQAGPRHAG